MTRRISILALSFAFIALPYAVSAQTALTRAVVPDNCAKGDVATNCGICDLAQLAQNVLNLGIYVAVFLSAVLFAWAGWKYLTAGGGEGISEARSIFANVTIGLVIILAGWLAVDTLMKTFTKGDFGPWNQVCTTNSVSSDPAWRGTLGR